MPYVARQQELPSLHGHPAAPQYMMFNSVVPPPSQHYQQSSQQPLNPRYPIQQDPMVLQRPLFRSQSASSGVPNHHLAQENLLRRKTPQGTLPAAYDAAPMEWSNRPTKQILLPYNPPNPRPPPPALSQRDSGVQTFNVDSWDKGVPQSAGAFRFQSADGTDMTMFPAGYSNMVDQNGYARSFLQIPPITDPIWLTGQPSGFQPMYNPITPPTASCDEINGYLMGGGFAVNNWQGRYSNNWEVGQTTPSQLPEAVNNMHLSVPYRPQNLPENVGLWSQQPPGSDIRPTIHHTQSAPTKVHHTHSFSLDSPLHLPQLNSSNEPFTNPMPSREKVAEWAHKAYVELLTTIQAQQRAGASVSSGSSSKPQLFPRPPSLNGIKHSLRQHSEQPAILRPDCTGRGGASGDILDRRKRTRHNLGTDPGYQGIGTSSAHSVNMNVGYPFPIQNAPMDGLYFGLDRNGYKAPVDIYPAGAQIHGPLAGAVNNLPSITNANVGIPATGTLGAKQVDTVEQAVISLDILERVCAAGQWTWIDGMLLGGCLSYGLGDLNSSLTWYRRILNVEDGHVEAMSNLAGTLLSLNRREEAEQYWRQVVKKRPSHFEAVEHLVGMLCGEHRGREAVDIINYVEMSLRRPAFNHTMSADGSLGLMPARLDGEYAFGNSFALSNSHGRGVFMISGSDNGRMVALIHAKGNMLYALGDNAGAAKAFEDAVLLASGINGGGIATLINRILIVLKAAMDGVNISELSPNPPHSPVLLSPDKAVQTARLVFPPDGQLPGLREVPKGAQEKAAISTTSNSLLSLAKIFQDGMSSGGAATAGRYGTSVKDILALYYLSLALHESPSTANNVGILLASIQPTVAVTSRPGSNNPLGAASGSGVHLALCYYNYGLQLDSRHAHLYTNLGSLLKDINQLGAAIKMYEAAVQHDPSFDIALANLANAVKDQGRVSDAIGYYRRAVKANPDFAEAVCGLANALNSVCDWKGRGGVKEEDGNRDRWHVGEEGKLIDAKGDGAQSFGWMKQVVDIVVKQLSQGEGWGRHVLTGEAMDRFLAQIQHAQGGEWPEDRRTGLRRTVKAWVGRPYEGAKLIRTIERASRRTVWRWYQDRYVHGINRPASEYKRPTVPVVLTTPSAPTVLPFHTFTCPLSAKQVRLISERNGLRISTSTLRATWLPPTVYPPPAPPAPYLRVGYISSDFNNHPLAHLMQSVFGLHNRERVKAFCYATTASDNSEHRKQIERESPVFYNAHSWSPERLISQIVSDGIHILINLNGFTRGARNEIFAARPAPIQMSFMGFAGTLGAEWCDYLYADTTAVPPETLRPTRHNVTVEDAVRGLKEAERDDWVYAENIIFAKYTFFCCDHRQSAPDSKLPRFSWEEETRRRWDMRRAMFPTLRDDQIILGNFNQLYKIEPTTFRTWLRILQQVPNAILWLLRFPDLGEQNLKSLAVIWAGSEVASRIIFTDVAPKPQHISRAQVCDLFLDTPECNAHTTAADVLWSGTPLLTLPRHKHKMCSRIAASILRAAVPQTTDGAQVADSLIATSEENYEEKAVELARGLVYYGAGKGEGALFEARRMIWGERWTSELFNTKRWVADLEDAYEEAWRRWVVGEGGDIDLKSLKSRR